MVFSRGIQWNPVNGMHWFYPIYHIMQWDPGGFCGCSEFYGPKSDKSDIRSQFIRGSADILKIVHVMCVWMNWSEVNRIDGWMDEWTNEQTNGKKWYCMFIRVCTYKKTIQSFTQSLVLFIHYFWNILFCGRCCHFAGRTCHDSKTLEADFLVFFLANRLVIFQQFFVGSYIAKNTFRTFVLLVESSIFHGCIWNPFS